MSRSNARDQHRRADSEAAPALPASRPFAPTADAPSAQASARFGHSFSQVSVFPPSAAPVQRKENKTGLPDDLKAGVENLSGYPMDDVNVHYNSSEPSQVQALAYAQGSDIHLAPGQEQHLPHEAWHVIQQRQGRVQPTLQAAGRPINDDGALESEADAMGARAAQNP